MGKRRAPSAAFALSPISLANLQAEDQVWQCIIGHLLADADGSTALYCLGLSGRSLYQSVLEVPFATLRDVRGNDVLRSELYFDAVECVHVDYCKRLLDSLDRKAQEYDVSGDAGGLVQFGQESRNLRQRIDARDGTFRIVTVHQTLHFINRAQLGRKLRELRQELQKAGVSVDDLCTQVAGGGASLTNRNTKPARSSKRAVVRRDSAKFLAAGADPNSLTVKQLQQALLEEAGIANAKGSKPSLVTQARPTRPSPRSSSMAPMRKTHLLISEPRVATWGCARSWSVSAPPSAAARPRRPAASRGRLHSAMRHQHAKQGRHRHRQQTQGR